MDIEQAIRLKLMINFEGLNAPEKLLEDLRRSPVAGVTLFRGDNIESLQQLRELTASLQAAARGGGGLPLLIAADQEGGQVMAVDGTPLPGNLMIGAARDENLAHRTGRVIGLELAAVGINVDYAPVVDVNTDSHNRELGVRSFGQDPARVSRYGAAFVQGLNSAGVAATAKHFPGAGDAAVTGPDGIPVVGHDLERLRQVELPPFLAAIHAGAQIVMVGHLAVPALNGGVNVPSMYSRPVLTGLLREELGFGGVIITDDLKSGPDLVPNCIAATKAGADLLLLICSEAEIQAVIQGLVQAVKTGDLDEAEVLASVERVIALKEWLADTEDEQPPLRVINCDMHMKLALETARRGITIARNDAGLLPVNLKPEQRIAAICPRPTSLSPDDTSGSVTSHLAEMLRYRHPGTVDEFLLPLDPSENEVRAMVEQARAYDLVVVGTVNARDYPGQAALVNALLQSEAPVVTAALRSPYDIEAYPTTQTYVCAYGLTLSTMHALAEAIFGQIPIHGRLPVQ